MRRLSELARDHAPTPRPTGPSACGIADRKGRPAEGARPAKLPLSRFESSPEPCNPSRVLPEGLSMREEAHVANEDRRYWPDAGLTVMGLAAIVALAISVSGHLSADSQISATRGFLLVCASSLALAASLPVLEGGSRGLVALFVLLCVLDLLGASIAAFLLERPVTIA